MISDREFHDWVLESRSKLVGAARLLLGDRGLAEDLVQDALVRILQRRRHIQAAAALNSYAWVTLWRLAQKPGYRRDARYLLEPHDDGHDNLASAKSESDRTVDRLELESRLGTLPPRQRATVVLRFYADMSVSEVAQVMGCSIGTVKNQTHKALQALARADSSRVEPGRRAAETR